MEWYLILIIVIISLIFIYFAIIYYHFRKSFVRSDKKGLPITDERHPYHKYKDHVLKGNAAFDSFDKEEVSVKSFDNLLLKGWYVKNKDNNKIIILFHGYHSSCKGQYAMSYHFHNLGYSLLIVDQRAHKSSQGKYIGMGVLERHDCLKWIEYVQGRFGREISIVLFGTSMGSATIMMASELIKTTQVKGLICDCGFDSCFNEICHVMNKIPKFPIMDTINLYSNLLAKYDMKKVTSSKSLANSNIPILIIHGKKDDFVPCSNALKCYEASKSSIKHLLLMEDSIHATCYCDEPEVYDKAIKDFLIEIDF